MVMEGIIDVTKNRVIFIPSKLCKMLQRYIRKNNIKMELYLLPERGNRLTEVISGQR